MPKTKKQTPHFDMGFTILLKTKSYTLHLSSVEVTVNFNIGSIFSFPFLVFSPSLLSPFPALNPKSNPKPRGAEGP